MPETSIRFVNGNKSVFYVQVEPVAGYYKVEPGSSLEIVGRHASVNGSFDLHEDGDVRYLTLLDGMEYDVVVEGKRRPFTEYLTNL